MLWQRYETDSIRILVRSNAHRIQIADYWNGFKIIVNVLWKTKRSRAAYYACIRLTKTKLMRSQPNNNLTLTSSFMPISHSLHRSIVRTACIEKRIRYDSIQYGVWCEKQKKTKNIECATRRRMIHRNWSSR